MREDLLGDLAHVIMEAKKSHNRPPASWRPWGAGGAAQAKLRSLRTGAADDVILRLRLKA